MYVARFRQSGAPSSTPPGCHVVFATFPFKNMWRRHCDEPLARDVVGIWFRRRCHSFVGRREKPCGYTGNASGRRRVDRCESSTPAAHAHAELSAASADLRPATPSRRDTPGPRDRSLDDRDRGPLRLKTTGRRPTSRAARCRDRELLHITFSRRHRWSARRPRPVVAGRRRSRATTRRRAEARRR